tara:strand:+ start:2459 stop:3295 length:837 start_codon:yes stop_codon:yes gene_type:complete
MKTKRKKYKKNKTINKNKFRKRKNLKKSNKLAGMISLYRSKILKKEELLKSLIGKTKIDIEYLDTKGTNEFLNIIEILNSIIKGSDHDTSLYNMIILYIKTFIHINWPDICILYGGEEFTQSEIQNICKGQLDFDKVKKQKFYTLIHDKIIYSYRSRFNAIFIEHAPEFNITSYSDRLIFNNLIELDSDGRRNRLVEKIIMEDITRRDVFHNGEVGQISITELENIRRIFLLVIDNNLYKFKEIIYKILDDSRIMEGYVWIDEETLKSCIYYTSRSQR